MAFDGKQPLMKDNLWWKMTFEWRQPQTIFCPTICLEPTLFWTKNFIRTTHSSEFKFVLKQNLFQPNIFWTQHILDPTFFDQFLFWPEIFLDPKFFGPKIFLDYNFFGSYLFSPKISYFQNFSYSKFVDLRFIMTLCFFWHKIFVIQNLFWSTFFQPKKCCSDRKSFF